MDLSTGWPEDLILPTSAEHVHAIGVVSLFYNELELALFSFFMLYLDASEEERASLFMSLNNQQRTQLIKVLAACDEDQNYIAALGHAMRCFAICSENRNLVMHSLTLIRDDPSMILSKLKRSQPGTMLTMKPSLAQIRAAAVGMHETVEFMLLLSSWRKMWAVRVSIGEPPEPLPARPAEPRSLAESTVQLSKP